MKNKTKVLYAVLTVLIAVAVLTESVVAYEYLPEMLGVVMVITGTAAF